MSDTENPGDAFDEMAIEINPINSDIELRFEIVVLFGFFIFFFQFSMNFDLFYSVLRRSMTEM